MESNEDNHKIISNHCSSQADPWLHSWSSLTLGCGVLEVHSPAASSPASRCSVSERRGSSRRSRCGAETRSRPEGNTWEHVRTETRLNRADSCLNVFMLLLCFPVKVLLSLALSLNWPRSTRRSRHPRSPLSARRARSFPPCCAVCRSLRILRPSAAPPPYSG